MAGCISGGWLARRKSTGRCWRWPRTCRRLFASPMKPSRPTSPEQFRRSIPPRLIRAGNRFAADNAAARGSGEMTALLRSAVIIVLTALGSTAWAEYNPFEAEVGIRWCNKQCSHSQGQCDLIGRMSYSAKNGDVLGVRIAFDNCQTGNDDVKIRRRANIEECFLNNPSALLRAACNVYGCEQSMPSPPASPAQ